MANAFSRSWEITKLSFNVIMKDKELLLFPLLAGVFSIFFVIAMLFPTILAAVFQGLGFEPFGIVQYIVLFITYFGLAFIATFFNVCVVYTTKIRFKGGNATFGESISFAFSKMHLILAWSLVAATVGIILRILENIAERFGQAGEIAMKIFTKLLGLAWGVITIFVVPVMVYDNVGPIDAIKKSAVVLKKTWGESLIRYFGMGMAEIVILFVGALLAWPLFYVSSIFGGWGMFFGILAFSVYFLGIILIFSAANTVFNTALYVYAETGKIPGGYSREIMQNAFKSSKR